MDIEKKRKNNNTTLVNGTRIALTCVTEPNLRLKSPFLSLARHAVSSLQFSSPLLRSFGLETKTDGRAVKNARGTAAPCTTLARVEHVCFAFSCTCPLYIYINIYKRHHVRSSFPPRRIINAFTDGEGRCVRARYID